MLCDGRENVSFRLEYRRECDSSLRRRDPSSLPLICVFLHLRKPFSVANGGSAVTSFIVRGSLMFMSLHPGINLSDDHLIDIRGSSTQLQVPTLPWVDTVDEFDLAFVLWKVKSMSRRVRFSSAKNISVIPRRSGQKLEPARPRTSELAIAIL